MFGLVNHLAKGSPLGKWVHLKPCSRETMNNEPVSEVKVLLLPRIVTPHIELQTLSHVCLNYSEKHNFSFSSSCLFSKCALPNAFPLFFLCSAHLYHASVCLLGG